MDYILPLIIIGFIVFRIIWRLAGNQKPVGKSGISILYPLFIYLFLITFAISKLFVNRTGILVLPPVSLITLLEAVVLGGIFAIPVLLTTNYELRQNQIYVQKNKTFIVVIIGVIALRIVLRSILYSLMPAMNLLFLTLIMATVYMIIWRVGSFVKFRRLSRNVMVN